MSLQTVTLRVNLQDLNFGDRVCSQRKFMMMSQEELAAKMGVDRSTITSYEKNRTIPRTLEMRKRLAKVLGLEYDELYDLYTGLAPKAVAGVSMEIDFGQLRRSLAQSSGLQLRCWKKMCRFLLEHAASSLTEKDTAGLESCLSEIDRIRKVRKKQNRVSAHKEKGATRTIGGVQLEER